MEKCIYHLSNTVIPNTKREKNIHVCNVLTQVGVKQLTDFLRTVTAASDLVDCTLVNCETVMLSYALRKSITISMLDLKEACLLCVKLSLPSIYEEENYIMKKRDHFTVKERQS